MNHDQADEFDARIRAAVARVIAAPHRRRAMHEELLSHLLCSYEEELARPGVLPPDAAAAALRRLGDPASLHDQLQASVPTAERLLFQFLSKEYLMSRWIWFLGVFAFFFGPSIILPALARHKQQGVPWDVVAPALVVGLAITAVGIATLVYGCVARLRRRTAA